MDETKVALEQLDSIIENGKDVEGRSCGRDCNQGWLLSRRRNRRHGRFQLARMLIAAARLRFERPQDNLIEPHVDGRSLRRRCEWDKSESRCRRH